MTTDPKTWHHGLVATWWALFNDSFRSHELDYYRDWVEAEQPVLDAGCGAGRLLVPFLEAGVDVDGCDVSADMIDACRTKARAVGHDPELRVQALHELDMPRRYRTIIVVGTFGVGSNRHRDQEALVRLREHLEPGGTLLLDVEVPYAEEGFWALWPAGKREHLPEEGRPPKRLRPAVDGAEYGLSSRLIEVDPLEQTVTMELHVERWRDGQLELSEDHRLNLGVYFRNEILLMLRAAGFENVEVHGEHQRRAATAEDGFLVFAARC
jgi:SAM-dependent methyltransferase